MRKTILSLVSTAMLLYSLLIWYGGGDWTMSAYLSLFGLLLSNEGTANAKA